VKPKLRDRALDLVLSFLTEEPHGESDQTLVGRLKHLLPGLGKIRWAGAAWVIVRSASADAAAVLRAVVRMQPYFREGSRLSMLGVGSRLTLIGTAAAGGAALAVAGVLSLSFLMLCLFRPNHPVCVPHVAVPVLASLGFGVREFVKRVQHRADARDLLLRSLRQVRDDRAVLAHLSEEQRHHNAVAHLLQEAEFQFRHLSDPGDVYTYLSTFLRRLIPESDGLSVWHLDHGSTSLVLRHAVGRHFELLERKPSHRADQGATGRALQTRRPYFMARVGEDPHAIPYLGLYPGSAIAIPLFTAEAPIGSVLVTRPTAGAFPDYQVWAADVLAGLAALRVHALSNRAREQRLVEELARLHDLVACKQAGGPSAPLDHFASHLRDASGAAAFVTLRVGVDGALSVETCRGLPAEHEAELRSIEVTTTAATLADRVDTACTFSTETLSEPAVVDLARRIGLVRGLFVAIPQGDGRLVGLVVLIFRTDSAALPWPDLLTLAETYARYTGVALHNLDLYSTVVRQSLELRGLLDRVVQAQEAERTRMARDLHDWLVQGLAAPAFQVQIARRTLDRSPAEARADLDLALQQLHKASEEIRRIMKGLRPYLLDELGLLKAVQAFAAEWSQACGIACTTTSDPAADLPKGSQHALAGFRIIQEALNNVAKHSGATQVRVSVERDGDSVLIRVVDNGRGLEAPVAPDGKHFGVMGMRERATAVGGTLSVAAPPSGGFTVVCRIPVPGPTR